MLYFLAVFKDSLARPKILDQCNTRKEEQNKKNELEPSKTFVQNVEFEYIRYLKQYLITLAQTQLMLKIQGTLTLLIATVSHCPCQLRKYWMILLYLHLTIYCQFLMMTKITILLLKIFIESKNFNSKIAM